MGNNAINNKTWEINIPKEEKNIKLDLKDLKIIHFLINNSRISLSNLKKIIRLSKPSLINRIKKLTNYGILGKDSCFINFLNLGASIYNIEIKTGFSINEKEKYIQYLKENPAIVQIISVSGKDCDLLIRVLLVHEGINNIIDYVAQFKIKDLNIFSVKKIYCKGLNLFKLNMDFNIKRKESSFEKSFNDSKIKIKKIKSDDIKLLYLLSNNSKLNIEELASKLNLSRDTIKDKISNLIRGEVILSFFKQYDLYKLGFSPYFLKIKVFRRKKQKEIIEYLLNTGKCHGIFEHEESWNILAFLSFKDRNDLSKFETEFLKKYKDIIEDYEFIIVQEQLYYNLFPKKIVDNFIKALDNTK